MYLHLQRSSRRRQHQRHGDQLYGKDLYLPSQHCFRTTRTPLHAAASAHGLENIYSNPLPHVLMLTAIVVGVATLAVGLALVVRIREAYGTIESDEIRETDLEVARAEFAVDKSDEASAA